MPEKVQEGGEVDLFADDSTAIETGDSVDEAMLKMKKTAGKLDKYASKNSLTILPKKCKIIIISRKKFIGPLPQVSISGKHIEVVNKCKCLGITIDQNLSWETHTSNICKSFSAKIKKLYNMRSMSKSTLKTIYFQGILPSVIYGIVIWGSSNHLSDVNKIHTKAARFIMKIKKNIPDDQVLRICNWKPIGFYYKRSVACKAYKIFKGESPPMLERLVSKSQTRATRNLYKVDVSRFRYTQFRKLFAYRAPNICQMTSDFIIFQKYNGRKS